MTGKEEEEGQSQANFSFPVASSHSECSLKTMAYKIVVRFSSIMSMYNFYIKIVVF